MAYLAIMGVALCVFVMLAAVSLMTGFVNKISQAAKGLFGEVIVETGGERGLGHYDEFIALTAGGRFPITTPLTYVSGQEFSAGLLYREAWAMHKGGLSKGETFDGDAQLIRTIPATATQPRQEQTLGTLSGRFLLEPLKPLKAIASDDAPGFVLRFQPDAASTRRLAAIAQPTQLTLRGAAVPMAGTIPDIQAAGPFILSFGMLRVEGAEDYRQHVQVAGIRLPDRADETDFEKGLWVQRGMSKPTFDPPIETMLERIHEAREGIVTVLAREMPTFQSLGYAHRKALTRNALALRDWGQDQSLSQKQNNLMRRLINAVQWAEMAEMQLERAKQSLPAVKTLRREMAQAEARGASAIELEELQEQIDNALDVGGYESPAYHMIAGLGIPALSHRTEQGDTLRFLLPGQRVILYIAPLGQGGSFKTIEPNIHRFTVVDDSQTDGSSIDNKLVYVPFSTLQTMNNMAAEVDMHTGETLVPNRCSQIHIKVNDPQANEAALRLVAADVQGVWNEFETHYPEATGRGVGVNIETWRQRQRQVIEPIESQRVLVIIIIGILSVVTITLIFVILYTIVVQKTREIGILKATGASSFGVAGLFFQYGAVIGLLGSIIGIGLGVLLVRNINPVHAWVGQQFGIQFWSKEHQMFAMIPNEVDWQAAGLIVAGSILAGLFGALLPAIRAARMQPVEALRYE